MAADLNVSALKPSPVLGSDQLAAPTHRESGLPEPALGSRPGDRSHDVPRTARTAFGTAFVPTPWLPSPKWAPQALPEGSSHEVEDQ